MPGRELPEGRECLRADVMLNAFGVALRYFLRDAQFAQKGDDNVMPPPGFFSQAPAFVS
jgi:hypothetical protein